MSRKVLKKGFLHEEEAEQKEIQGNYTSGVVPWSNPNGLQATDGITSTTQGPGMPGTRRKVSSARYQDTSPGAEALSQPRPGCCHPVFIEEERPGAVVVPGIDHEEAYEDDGFTIEEENDEQATIASHEDESTINVIARAVDTEEESRMRHELDDLHQMQIRHEHQLRQILVDNSPIVTPVIATRRDVENQNENVHANHDDLPSSVHPKCGSKGRQWFAMSAAILLIVVAIAVTLALVLQSEPTPPWPTTLGPNTQEPTTIAPTAQPPPSQDLIDLLSSASSDGGVALADTSTPQNKALMWLAGDPNIGNYTDQEKLQRYALATLYYTTEGDSWNENHYWLSYDLVCGRWYQYDDTTIICTPDGAVSDLDLHDNNLQGSIPPEISMLSDSLVYLWLDENELEGTLPTEIGKLTKLTTLSFLNNSLIGAIPSVIGLLTNLEELWLYNNELDGTIPTEIGELTKLTPGLSLGDNSLTGAIPSVIGLLTNLEGLWLYNNALVGDIPTEIGALTKLTLLSLPNNTLTGAIPSNIGLLTDLEGLWLYNNALEGDILMEIGELTKLTALSLWNNSLTGTIFPNELGLLTKLTRLELDHNLLTGTIPPSIGTFTNLDFLDFGFNNLTGKIPTELGLLTKLTYLYLSSNGLTGTIPSELGLLTKLTWLGLHSNELTGTVPTSLASLTLLKRLFLFDNNLTGSLLGFLCGNEFEYFAANTCGQDEIECECCTHCCDLEGYCF